MPLLKGLLETALYVADLERAAKFYQRIFGFETLLQSERVRALKIVETQILLLFIEGGSTQGEATAGGFIPPHDARGRIHLAFAIELDTVDEWRAHLGRCGVEIESEVDANQGHSIYFRDPDGHAIELGTAGLWELK